MHTKFKRIPILTKLGQLLKMDILTSIQHTFNSLSGNSFLGKVGIAAGSIITSYFTPIAGLLITCLAATVVDMYYGMRVARKLGKKLTSKKNWKGTLCKIKDEFILISLTHLLEHATMGADGIFVLSGGVTAIIALTEIWSIIENLNTLDPDGPWKVLGKFLKKKGEDFTGVEFDLKNNKNDDNNDTKPVEQCENSAD